MSFDIPTKMKALVLPEAGKFEIQEVEVPQPGEQEVLCRVRGVAICGSDPELVHGGLAGYWPPAYPFTPGHEWSGEVVAVGAAVRPAPASPLFDDVSRGIKDSHE